MLEINRNHQQGGGSGGVVVGRLVGGYGTGRAKVTRYHLNSRNRRALSALQGVGDHFMLSFVRIGPSILPDLVALVKRESGLSDSYRLMAAKNSELWFLMVAKKSELWLGRYSCDERASQRWKTSRK